MTTVLIVSTVLNVALLVSLVSSAVLFLNALQRSADLTNRVHERDQKHVTALVDRLIAGDYRTFREYPDEDEEGGMTIPGSEEIELSGGVERRTTDQMRADAEEELLLRQDFPEVFHETG